MTEDTEITKNLRREMVENQIRRRGVRDRRVLEAMLSVPRHLFMPGYSEEAAYGDHAMPIGHGQTISQPYMVAVMTQLLVRNAAGRGKVLEIGAGSGYQAAILSLLFERVISIERIAPLAEETEKRLKELGYGNIRIVVGDGTLGHVPQSPYDGIMVTAAAPHVPEALTQQLADGGCLVVPVGSRFLQELMIVTKKEGKLGMDTADGCVFVPLVGKDGWED
jgi:protein-L-isoaspartate(D-aspartate) O-methyltransferase